MNFGGQNFQSSVVCVSNGRITVNGTSVEDFGAGSGSIKVEIHGDVDRIESDAPVEVHGAVKNIDCSGGCVVHGDVSGNIKCAGSVSCGNVGGSLNVAGSVSMRKRI